MNYYDYDLTKADECIKLANDISDEYSMLYGLVRLLKNI